MKFWLLFGLLLATSAFAQQAGPTIVTAPDVTATTCAGVATQIVPASTAVAGGSTPKRICEYLSDVHATIAARCGDSSVSTTQGIYLAPVGGSWTLCIAGPVYCCGVGGSTTIGNAESDR